MDTPAQSALAKIAAHATAELRARLEARAAELEAQADQVQRQAELQLTVLRSAAAELRAQAAIDAPAA